MIRLDVLETEEWHPMHRMTACAARYQARRSVVPLIFKVALSGLRESQPVVAGAASPETVAGYIV